MNDYFKIASGIMFPGLGITNLVAESLSEAIKKSNSVSEGGDIKKLEEEARIQEIENRISEFQARVAQELAIARRIENAAEVEIEEFYDTSGNGGVGAQVTEGTINLGAHGAGRKVTSRIYRFKGWVSPEIPNSEEVLKHDQEAL